MTAPTGSLIAEYKQRSAFNARRRLILWIILGIAAIAAIGAGVASPDNSSTQTILIIGGWVLMMVAFIAFFVDLRRAFMGKTMEVYSDGFVIHYENGKVQAAYQWGEVKECDLISRNNNRGYYGGGVTGVLVSLAADAIANSTINNAKRLRYLSLRLVTADKKRFWADQKYRDFVPMLDSMSRAMSAALLTQAMDYVKAGQNLQFGIVTVTPQGLYKGGETLPWNNVSAVTLGGLAVEVKGIDPKNQKQRTFVRVSPALDRPVLAQVIRQFAPNAQVSA